LKTFPVKIIEPLVALLFTARLSLSQVVAGSIAIQVNGAVLDDQGTTPMIDSNHFVIRIAYPLKVAAYDGNAVSTGIYNLWSWSRGYSCSGIEVNFTVNNLSTRSGSLNAYARRHQFYN
jgi:hypothetical protein